MTRAEQKIRREALIDACKAVCHWCAADAPHGADDTPWDAVREIKKQSRCRPIRNLIAELHGEENAA